MAYHVPALLNESIDGLNIRPDGTYVDLTFGGGGHSRAIVERLGPKGRLLAFDRDLDALRNAIDDPRFCLIRGNFQYFHNFLGFRNIEHVDGILADLGLSSHHLDSPERGFAFSHNGPLDMRMNRQARLSARDVLTTYPEEQLAQLLRTYGELDGAHRIARRIAEARERMELNDASDLVAALEPIVPTLQRNKTLAQVFQAIRIEVNHELDALRAMLHGAGRALRVGGRLAVISYHSLEDRMVKNYLRTGSPDGLDGRDTLTGVGVRPPFEPVNRRVITPSPEEQAANSRSRSAKLRVGQRIA